MMGIHLAAQNGHLPILQEFRENGMDMKVKGEEGMSILHLAAREGHLEMV